MPRGDGTGPMGMGPITGRGMGFCAVPVDNVPVRGIGFGFGKGRGFGGGRGCRNMFYATGLTGWQRAMAGYPVAERFADVSISSAPTSEQEVEILKKQSEFYSNALSDIERRLKELENLKAEVK